MIYGFWRISAKVIRKSSGCEPRCRCCWDWRDRPRLSRRLAAQHCTTCLQNILHANRLDTAHCFFGTYIQSASLARHRPSQDDMAGAIGGPFSRPIPGRENAHARSVNGGRQMHGARVVAYVKPAMRQGCRSGPDAQHTRRASPLAPLLKKLLRYGNIPWPPKNDGKKR